MKRVKIEVEYCGTNFKGWQAQNHINSKERVRTVQEEIQKVLTKFFNQEIVLHASGRTDAGVHAKGQVAHFDVETIFEIERLPLVINNLLPSDIAIKYATEVDFSFHARYSSKEKTYKYFCYMSSLRKPINEITALQVPEKLNLKAMKKALKILKGTHDFTSFQQVKRRIAQPQILETQTAESLKFYTKEQLERYGKKINSSVRTISKINLKKQGDKLTFTITGNGFLHSMVRIIVGTVLEVGKANLTLAEFEKILNAKDRTKAKKTVSGAGLYLWKVKY